MNDAIPNGSLVGILSHDGGGFMGYGYTIERADKRAPDDWYYAVISVSPLAEPDRAGVPLIYHYAGETFNVGERKMVVITAPYHTIVRMAEQSLVK